MVLKSPIIKISRKTKSQDFYGHTYKCDSQGISKQLFSYMQTLSNAIIFGVLYRVKLLNNNPAVRKHVKVPPWHRHTYWHKRWRPWLWNPRTSVKSTRNQLRSRRGRGASAHRGSVCTSLVSMGNRGKHIPIYRNAVLHGGGWRGLQLRPLPTRGREALTPALARLAQSSEKKMRNGKHQNETYFLLTLKS